VVAGYFTPIRIRNLLESLGIARSLPGLASEESERNFSCAQVSGRAPKGLPHFS